jgi:hypothetical protein
MAEKVAAPIAPAIGFTKASRPMRSRSNVQTVSNLSGATSLQPISLPVTGWMRRIRIMVTLSATAASAGAVVAGDGPFSALSNISLTDAKGTAVIQPVSGYELYLINKYLDRVLYPNRCTNPHQGPGFAFASTATTLTSSFILDLNLEVDPHTGYGCIPNLDSNASPLLRIDVNPYSAYWGGTTVSASTVSVQVQTDYWGPISQVPGVTVQDMPAGAGDFRRILREGKTVSASVENKLQLSNRGGLMQGAILISRASGTRTALTASSNVGALYDNNPMLVGVPVEAHMDEVRRQLGYTGADLTTSYAPLTAGVDPGLDAGVLPVLWGAEPGDGDRSTWLNTRVGTQLEIEMTPGASATQLSIVSAIAQVRDPAAFYGVV